MYDATALMPIRARVLRRPASNAATRPSTVSAGVIASAPRVPASSAASSIARRGWTAVAPTARTMAIAWTSRMSDALTATSVRPRRPASVRAVCTAPVARIEGTGSRSIDQAASLTTTRPAPRREAATASVPRRSRAASRPAGPAAGSQVASRVATLVRPARTVARSPSRSMTIGRDRRTVRGARGGPPRRAGRRPSSTRRSITTRSRSGSIAGLVTWANAWRRWSATGRSSRPRPGVGVSSPMLQSGSWPSSAIVLMSSRARSASRPAR